MMHDGNKKILIFHPTIAPYRIDFFNDLYKSFYTSIYLYYENLLDQKFDYEHIKRRFEFSPTYFQKKIRIGKRVLPIGHCKAIISEKPDVVIVGEYGFGFWTAVLYRLFSRKKYRIISICDDSYDLAVNSRSFHSKSRNIGIRFLDGLILCNRQVADFYMNQMHFKKIYVFPIIHKDENYRENLEEICYKANIKIKQNNLLNKRVFLFVGRISPEKNIEYLIDSFILYHKEFPENRLYIIGDYIDKNIAYYEKLVGLVSDNKAESYIVFLGRKEGEDLKIWYIIGQVLILPSRYEPFGAVVNEALLLGERVVVSSKAGSTMLINGDNGIVIDINQPHIDFELISEIIDPLSGEKNSVSNNMPFHYNELMQGLLTWLKEI